jgi:hypothetical protein
MLFFLCMNCLVPLSAGATEFKLNRHAVHLIEVEQSGERYWYDDRIAQVDVKALYLHFKRKVDDPVPLIYAVPGMKGYFVVSSWDERFTDKDYGRRLYLVRKKGSGFEDVDRTAGAGDSYILTPAFFRGQGRILILAEIGTEYSWGLLVYEIIHKRLVFLGPLDAAVEGEVDAEAPTPFAGVKNVNGRWLVEFSRDLVLDAGGLHEQSIMRRENKPIIFEYDGKSFIPKEGTFTVVSRNKEP